jgi:hypothetical protein
MKNSLDAMNNVRDEVNAVASDLLFLAQAFRVTGNNQVAERLAFNAESLQEVIKPLMSAWNKDMDEQLGHGEAMMGNLVNLALSCEIKPLATETSDA